MSRSQMKKEKTNDSNIQIFLSRTGLKKTPIKLSVVRRSSNRVRRSTHFMPDQRSVYGEFSVRHIVLQAVNRKLLNSGERVLVFTDATFGEDFDGATFAFNTEKLLESAKKASVREQNFKFLTMCDGSCDC